MRRIVLTERRLEALRNTLEEMKTLAKENPCDHSVGICCCAAIEDMKVIEQIITGKKSKD